MGGAFLPQQPDQNPSLLNTAGQSSRHRFLQWKKVVSAAVFSELTMRKISWSEPGTASSGAVLLQEF